MNILLTCAGRRHYLARYIKDFIGNEGRLVGADMSPFAPALAACDKAYRSPAISSPDYLSSLIDICNKEQIDYVFSLNDLELQLLADNNAHLTNETSAIFIISSSSAIQCCADKFETYQMCRRLGVPSPLTFIDLEDVKLALSNNLVRFPLMIKPRWGSASIGLFKVDNFSDLDKKFLECRDSVVNSHIASQGDISNSVIIQEFIQGNEFGVDVLNDLNGKLIGFSAKRKLSMRAGETDKAVTVRPTPFSEIVSSISSELKHIGNLDCDFLEKEGRLYLLEMNPRFGGGYPFTHMAGANHIELLLSDTNVREKKYEYTVGRCFAKCDILIDLDILPVTESKFSAAQDIKPIYNQKQFA